jgi:hypothetical protein
MTLPPVLYWSRSLADRLNETVGDEHSQHGLIDATVATVMLAWSADSLGWVTLADLPDDAVRLVADAPATEVTTEFGARFGADTNSSGADEHAAMEEAAAYGGVFVSRRVTRWVDADPSGETS